MDDITVRQSSIEGLGIFAVRPFSPGDRIHQINVIRTITPEAPLRPDLGERQDHCDYPDGEVVLLGFPDRHVNHSCDPNAYVLYTSDASYFAARREIPAGYEISIDYNINIVGGTAWPCHCGATRCNGIVVGDFFLLPSTLQLEYLPLLAEWFVLRHHERLSSLSQSSQA